jgi:hypothetical protein
MNKSQALQRLIEALEETLGAPSPQRSSASWKGFIAPLGGAQQLAPANRDYEQPFPYRTQTAEVVWKHLVDLIPKHPDLDTVQLLQKAIEVAGVDPLDLSPEDWRLLEMAIEWRKDGIQYVPRPRIGGAPGGPFNSVWMGRTLSKRGAP